MCLVWLGRPAAPPARRDTMNRNEYLVDAIDFLGSISDASWTRVCGSQCREAFAQHALDAGESIEDAWIRAVQHANTL